MASSSPIMNEGVASPLEGSSSTRSSEGSRGSGLRDSSTLPSIFTAPSSTPSTPLTGTSSHSRNGSSDTIASTGSAYHFILEHLLTYPGTYGPLEGVSSTGTGLRNFANSRTGELPLRSMYTLNSAAPSLSSGSSTPPSQGGSPTALSFQAAAAAQLQQHQLKQQQQCSPTLTGNAHRFAGKANAPRSPAAAFMSSIMDQIAQIPQQPASLPPAFVTSFLNRCFPVVLEAVDFPQSLTALDYLRDLEMRRRKEIAYALMHHGIDQTALEACKSSEQLAEFYPQVAHYLVNLESREKRADALYTQLYVALRRWILINEMALTPFNKHNCHAMLNTLYPPVEMSQPTTKLTIPLLKAQREGFFNYIRTVERQGPMCLQTLMQQGSKPGDPNGWPAVKRTLNNYLRLSNSMILESQDISSLEVVSYNCWNTTPQLAINAHSLHAGPNMESSLTLEPVFESAQEQEEDLVKEPNLPSTASASTEKLSGLSAIGKASPQIPQQSFQPQPPSSYQQAMSKHKGKTDSGFSFGSDGRHSKHPSTSSSRSGGSASGSGGSSRHTSSSTFDFGRGSTLERLARELRTNLRSIGRKVVADEIIPAGGGSDRFSQFERKLQGQNAVPSSKQPDRSSGFSTLNTRSNPGFTSGNKLTKEPKGLFRSDSTAKLLSHAQALPSPSPTKSRFPSLRKMKSFGDFGGARSDSRMGMSMKSMGRSQTNLKGSPTETPIATPVMAKENFNVEEMKRRRAEYDMNQGRDPTPATFI